MASQTTVTDPETFEGTWEEIFHQAGSKLSGHRLRVTILPDTPIERTVAHGMLRKGMFPQLAALTDEDFKSAEFSESPEDDGSNRIPVL